MPLSVAFDVNDERLRKEFLRELLPTALQALHERTRAAWGKMSPQEMVEHLTWAFEVSTGHRQAKCPLPEENRERMKPFLYGNQPSPHEFMNPALAAGLPPLEHPRLSSAIDALNAARNRFLEPPGAEAEDLRMHPIFGPLGRDDWSRVHFKHSFHHLQQFGLIVAL